jgi:hypothetical protein
MSIILTVLIVLILCFVGWFIITGILVLVYGLVSGDSVEQQREQQRQYEQDQHFKAQSWIIDTVDLTQLEAPQEVKARWSPEYQAYIEGMLTQYREQCLKYGTPTPHSTTKKD